MMDYKKEALIRRRLVGFKPVSDLDKKQVFKNYTNSELVDYYAKERLYNYVHTMLPSDVSKKQEDYPLVKAMLQANRLLLNQQRYKLIGDKRHKQARPVVYAVTHVGLYDYQVITEALNAQTYAFAGDPEQVYGSFDGWFMDKSGAIFCNTEDFLDRYISEEMAVRFINHGANLLIYPEGIWNITANLLVLPLWPGTIRIAQAAHVDIVPVAIEQYGKKFIINIGENIVLNNFDTNDIKYINEMKQQLRDNLATLKYEIFESRRVYKRKKLGDFDARLKDYENMRLNEWKDKNKNNIYSRELVEHRKFVETDVETSEIVGEKVLYSSPQQAFSYMKNLKVNKNNIFLLRRDMSLPTSIQEEAKKIVVDNSSYNHGEAKKLIL